MDYILDLFLNQIFGQSFILMGLVVFIGYIAMKQKFSKALSGAFKASIGILVLGMGSGTLIANFNHLLAAVQTATGIQGAGLNTYPTMTAAYEKMDLVLGVGMGATWGIYTLLAAFVLNLVFVALKKFTKIRAVFLTGNVMLTQSAVSVYIVWYFLRLDMIPTVLIAALITAIYQGYTSTMLIKATDHVTGGAGFTIAHQQMFMSYVAYKVAPKLGSAEKDDIEKKKMPESLNILQDNIIATALVMLISVVAIFLVIGPENIDLLRTEAYKQTALKNDIILLFWITFSLTANIVVLLSGVRMFVGELMVSFQGISQRILPGAVAGVDCSAIFAFAPKSVVLGLVAGATGQILGVILLIVTGSPIFIIPGFIPLFFDNATIAIFANKAGGYKAAIILCFTNGLIQIFGSALAVSMLDLTWWQGSADYATVWVAITAIFKFIGSLFGIQV